MRTTITLADDTAAAVEQLRREADLGMSEAVNELLRRGAAAASTPPRPPFRQRSFAMGERVDVRNIAETLETLDGPAAG
jgi:hypothetical protein